jgi:hypothetical protein
MFYITVIRTLEFSDGLAVESRDVGGTLGWQGASNVADRPGKTPVLGFVRRG